mmetsp:Transcript_18398/g.73797  ORF Transcript_18398/g.73797 Transcript_18398/m.73797 type:complete len:448 (-) Transcript_18398:3941-5284(-)
MALLGFVSFACGDRRLGNTACWRRNDLTCSRKVATVQLSDQVSLNGDGKFGEGERWMAPDANKEEKRAAEDPAVQTVKDGKERTRRRTLTEETKARISASMLGKKKSEAMKIKLSEAHRGKIPWNKGKKLDSETRTKMSKSQFGRTPWNKGRRLSSAHRRKISEKMAGRKVSEDTRKKLRMARRRPGDDVVVSSRSKDVEDTEGNFALVDTDHIHEFVSLRRDLRVWSDEFADRIGRRPSITDVRRIASNEVASKFERYLRIRDRIRGLAKDVYGSVDPEEVPVASPRLQKDAVRVERSSPDGIVKAIGEDEMIQDESESDENVRRSLTKSDYRLIGQYRLMENNDIHTFIQLRKELKRFSDNFKEREGRVPALSDIEQSGKLSLYRKFEQYLAIREKMNGLVTEVYGLDVDNLEEIERVSRKGQHIIEQLRHTKTEEETDEESKLT